MPTTTGEAFKIGSKDQNPVDAYKEDIFTVTINVVGVPSLNSPFGKGQNGLPLGIQLLANKFDEKTIYKFPTKQQKRTGKVKKSESFLKYHQQSTLESFRIFL